MHKFLWPHENREFLKSRAERKTNKTARSFFVRFIRRIREAIFIIKTLVFFKTGYLGRVEKETMFIFNGQDTEKLADKFEFLEIVAKMDYQIPKQVLINKEETAEEKVIKLRKTFSADMKGFYCKPESGYMGHGIVVLPSLSEVEKFLEQIEENYVIEEEILINKEFRYIRYVDSENNIWRMIFEKVRPTVVGDGHSFVWQLLLSKGGVPDKAKQVIMTQHWWSLWKILPKGQKLQLTKIGIPSMGGFNRLPMDQETENLDLFMKQFIEDLEKTVGHPLPVLCFDMGVTDSVLEKKNFRQLREVIYPFECQMPFAPSSYFVLVSDGARTFLQFYQMLLKDLEEKVGSRLEKFEDRKNRGVGF